MLRFLIFLPMWVYLFFCGLMRSCDSGAKNVALSHSDAPPSFVETISIDGQSTISIIEDGAISAPLPVKPMRFWQDEEISWAKKRDPVSFMRSLKSFPFDGSVHKNPTPLLPSFLTLFPSETPSSKKKAADVVFLDDYQSRSMQFKAPKRPACPLLIEEPLLYEEYIRNLRWRGDPNINFALLWQGVKPRRFLALEMAISCLKRKKGSSFARKIAFHAAGVAIPSAALGEKGFLTTNAACDFVEVFDTASPIAIPRLQDGYSYEVDGIELEFVGNAPQHMLLGDLYAIQVNLLPSQAGYVAARGEEKMPFLLKELGGDDERYFSSALQSIAQSLVQDMQNHGYVGVYVAVDEKQIDAQGNDLRQEGDKSIKFTICTSYLDNLHIMTYDPCNDCFVRDAKYKRLARSCVDFCGIDGNCLLNMDCLNERLYLINRYPGRSVTAEISDVTGQGAVTMDLRVLEDRPRFWYVNVSNTGTSATTEWLEHLGYNDYQFTGHDDTLNIDLATASFDSSYSASGYYDAPFWNSDRLRWRIDGAWSNFEVKIEEVFSAYYKGRQWKWGPSLTYNFYQCRDFFADLRLGTYWMGAFVQNNFYNINVSEKFFLPTIGIACERKRPTSSFSASLDVETNLPHVASTNKALLFELGRDFPSADWWLAYFHMQGSFYYNPCVFVKASCEEKKSNLVHEFYACVKGQYAFNYRLIPQKEAMLGGLYTVRGYPQGFLVGDSSICAQFEYRFHMPKNLQQNECFYGKRNWDGLLRLFFDAGTIGFSQPMYYEKSNSLMGSGFGVEFVYKRNMLLRADLGVALKDVEQYGYKSGVLRGYVTATWMF